MVKAPPKHGFCYGITGSSVALAGIGHLGRAEAFAALLHFAAPAKIPKCPRHASSGCTRTLMRSDEPDNARGKAARAVRLALGPLIANRASCRILREVAVSVAGSALCHAECESLMVDIVARYLRQRRRYLNRTLTLDRAVIPVGDANATQNRYI